MLNHLNYAKEDARIVLHRLEEFASGTVLSKPELARELSKRFLKIGYGQSKGEMIPSLVIANYLNQLTREDLFTINNLVLTCGVSEGFGACLKLMRMDGFLKKGDSVIVQSPIYTPYLDSLQGDYNIIPLNCRQEAGFLPTEEDKAKFVLDAKNAKLAIIVDPNNPTGRKLDYNTIQFLAEMFRENGTIVIVDEIYTELTSQDHTEPRLIEELPELCIHLGSNYKAGRQTGARMGWIAWATEFEFKQRARITGNPDISLAKQLAEAKAIYQPLQDVHTPALDSQWESTIRLLARSFGNDTYQLQLRHGNEIFRETLGIPSPTEGVWNHSFIAFDLYKDIVSRRLENDFGYKGLSDAMHKGDINPIMLLRLLAETKGVVLLYAATFFHPSVRQDNKWMVRVSCANQPYEGMLRSAYLIDQFFDELANQYPS